MAWPSLSAWNWAKARGSGPRSAAIAAKIPSGTSDAVKTSPFHGVEAQLRSARNDLQCGRIAVERQYCLAKGRVGEIARERGQRR